MTNLNTENELTELKRSLIEIQTRNKRVELDKAWETSLLRKASIAMLTYIVMTVFMWSLGNETPYINSIIPTLGFILSTFSLGFLKSFWLKVKNFKK